jgi:hypothetical protein
MTHICCTLVSHMARLSLHLKDLGVVEVPMDNRETRDRLLILLRGLGDFRDRTDLRCLLLLSPPVVRRKDKSYELLTSHARFAISHLILGEDMPITAVDDCDAQMYEEFRSIDKILEGFLCEQLRGLPPRDDPPTAVIPDGPGPAKQPGETRPRQSRPTEARRRRIAAGQICPVCARTRGKHIPVSVPKNWKQLIAANRPPFARGQIPLISCQSCGFVLGVTLKELAGFNSDTNRMSMSDLLRPSNEPCPLCQGVTYDILSAGVPRWTVCEGRLRSVENRRCDYFATLTLPGAGSSSETSAR